MTSWLDRTQVEVESTAAAAAAPSAITVRNGSASHSASRNEKLNDWWYSSGRR